MTVTAPGALAIGGGKLRFIQNASDGISEPWMSLVCTI